MVNENLTQSIEDYLKAIYELTLKEGRASTTQLADYLKITPASVTGMIKKLSRTSPPLLEYQKHQGVVLTSEGKDIALQVVRNHRLLELFLHKVLNYPWEEVDDEADRLEHVISQTFEERIAAVLGNPEYDPHGDPIPNKDLTLPDTSGIQLSTLRSGQSATVTRVRDTDSNLLKHLSEIGIIPGAEISVADFSEFDGNLHIKIDRTNKVEVLGPRITDQIFITLKS
jgi:DtxR family Mn-dependent transcriptional regulator